MIRTANPALNAQTFTTFYRTDEAKVMTLSGTVNKTLLLLTVLVLAASYVWRSAFSSPHAGTVSPWMIVGAVAGFVFSLLTVFKKQWSMVTAPVYAGCQGLFLGGLSALLEFQYPGIVIQAVGLTFGTLFCLLFAYKSGWIKVTENFRLGVVAATGGIALIYFVTFILGFFHVSVPFIHQNGMFGIIFSVVIVTIAAMNLVLDFDFIERGAKMSVPKYMEWYSAFGLMVTLIWLYIEILRLLVKARERK